MPRRWPLEFSRTASFLKFSRDDEREADRVGLQLMRRAGWDGRGMVELFEILQRKRGRNPSSVEVFFSSHPSPQDRIQELQADVERASTGAPATAASSRAIKARLLQDAAASCDATLIIARVPNRLACRTESVSSPAQRQSGRLVPVGRRGVRAGAPRGQADLPVDRLLDLSLVPCDGARELRERRGRRGAQPPLRVDQGRSRGAAGRRSRLHDVRAGRRPGLAAGR